MKWDYRVLLEAWSALVKRSTDRDTFKKKRDALMLQAGWTQAEFGRAVDAEAVRRYTGRGA